MTWLVLLPAILGCVIVLTGWAHSRNQDLTTHKPCTHAFYIFGRCIECGTPR